ncbi:pyrroloquinoline-quinone aldehyde dehydrogenase [Azorhizobium caulinodans ORS 571]|uniref:Pyrroloquinoline-quinone aldehyde dehydrogenase n=1 Tax=Azorhizobium caulinodans (strain ATCC 43989 / DSM 5975 / JCM 20966 / LMG 6465 / NBRC 14845 / NCIMB 13405 / ORS 571) TaxID=438753 RepID=A8I9K3_AZOC5|nr:molybdopterin cofactor-binding domain-containing protein [Azorhizobium caulinodans]BAF88799.1 pyrroloquinoline-quinone aldehyde dehydrogenase [Azorhizobium caulinodans ORS 571]
MTEPAPSPDALLARAGTLAILRPAQHVKGLVPTAPPPEGALDLFLFLDDEGRTLAFNGHVDLGTGIRTALAQIVAEELDLPIDRVTMVLGHTGGTPNQGATIASDSIQISAQPLRRAAAQARHHLVALAAEALGLPEADLTVTDGVVHPKAGGNAGVSYAALIAGRRDRLMLAESVALKPVSDYRIVGQRMPRVDIPAKATGTFTYVHDVRVPGMLHGRVVRPPYAGIDAGDFIGKSLIAVDESSVADIPGMVAVVTMGDFVGVVAEREEQAAEAARRLKVRWKEPPPLPADLTDIPNALRTNPSKPRLLHERGDVEAAHSAAAQQMDRTYVWPYQMHASIGPSCAVTDVRPEGTTVWSGTQNPYPLRADIALLLGLPEETIEIVRFEAAGCYGRNCADDVAADAALLSRAVGRPVRVQLTREQEHAWEPKGAAQLMEIRGGITADGSPAAYDFSTRYPSNAAVTLALLLTGRVPADNPVFEMGDRTAIPPYAYDNMRVVAHDMAPIVRAAWLRGVSALPNSFAHESYIDELAAAAGVDPVEYRLRYLHDPRAVDLVKEVAAKAGWEHRTGARQQVVEGDIVRGQGFAYALYVHSKFPGYGAAWSAWVADVEVNKATGDVNVTRVVVGQDSGLMINPAGIEHQIHGNVIQSTSRALKEEVSFSKTEVASREWGAYPILTFPEVPVIKVVLMPRPEEPPLGSGESASVPSAAAIANAIFDATGVRFREPPFTPDRVRAALTGEAPPPDPKPEKKKRSWFALAGAALAGALGMASVALPIRGAIAPITPPDPTSFSAEMIARGKQLAALGDCAVCHTLPGGVTNAGGRAMETPFGTVYATNLTPDPETGIGRWSYAAFERAMREGISRDGRHLYPAFPYTAFTKTSDTDLQALYAYLMSQPAVSAPTPEAKMAFPFNIRPLMAGWNALFLKPGQMEADPARSPQWNRGAYLVDGLGHCGACHTPRNVLGAEKTGAAYLAGGMVDGWEAPALTALSSAPIPWTEEALYSYLRTGFSPHHGTAAGPMAPVVQELSHLPDADIRAMATYLASFSGPAPADPAARAAELQAKASASLRPLDTLGGKLYEGACAACHSESGPTLFGVRPELALNTNVHAARPDNLIRVILDGIPSPAARDLGDMPAFRESLDDGQVAALVRYIRAKFAPDAKPWEGVDAEVTRLRSAPTTH